MNKKKFLSILLTIIIMVSATMSFSISYAASNVKIELFGEIITLPDSYGEPFIDTTTSRTLVPARGLFEAIGATVNWTPENRAVTVTKDGLEIKVSIDSTLAFKNTKAVVLDQPAVIKGDRTYVPLRFIAESLDLDVDFNENTTTVVIKESAKKTEVTDGVYEIGRDLDSTEYLFVANASAKDVNVKLLKGKDSSKTENVITTVNFKDSAYISLIGCKYVELVGCTAKSLDTFSDRKTDGSYQNGMFKVGKDLEPGMYAVSRVDSKQPASYKTYYFPFSASQTNEAINEIKISVNRNILLRKGQYILLDNAKLSLVQVSSTEASGGGGSSNSGSRPVVIPSATQTPTSSPTSVPAAPPAATEIPVIIPPPAAEPTADPNISTELFYPEFDGTIYDFGYCFQLPTHLKDGIDGYVVDYMYEITSSELIENDTVNVEYLKAAYGEKFLNEGFVETNVPGSILGEYRLYNAEKSIEIICYFSKREEGITLYYVNVTILRNASADN